MIALNWRCSRCGSRIWYVETEGWSCSSCGAEYLEQDGGLVPLVQPGTEEQGGKHSPRPAGKRHKAGWRERTG